MLLRDAVPGDAPGWAAVLRAVSPYLVTSAAKVGHDMAAGPAGLHRQVALDGSRVVGICRVRPHGSRFLLQLQVMPGHRGLGIGSALLGAAVPRVAGRPLEAIVNGDPESLSVAARWGFELVHRHAIAAGDPRTARPPSAATIPLSALGPRTVWECYRACADDDPSGLSVAPPYDQFVSGVWHDPLHRPRLGRAVVEGKHVVAVALVSAAGTRAWNDFTGTRRAARGRGLARTVKAAVLGALAGAGVTSCGTGNDTANAAMLAVNASLGNLPVAVTYGARRPSVEPGLVAR